VLKHSHSHFEDFTYIYYEGHWFRRIKLHKLRDIKAQNFFISITEKLEFHFLLVWTRLQKQESVSDTKLMAEVMSVFNPFKNEVKLNAI
jgi:hypothetical protein